MNKTLTRDVKSKAGTIIRKGEKVDITFKPGQDSVFRMTAFDGREVATRDTTAIGIKPPSLAKLEKWSEESVCNTIFGERTEPDGHGPSGAPSWLLFMGMI